MGMALKLHNKKWYPLIFLILSVAFITTCFLLPITHQPQLLFSGIVAIAGFVYFLYRQHLDETKLFKELFVEFNKRYDVLNDNLNTVLFGPREGELTDAEREVLFRYFNLCAEEYFFYQAGYIDHDVWKSWHTGMATFFAHPRIRKLWDGDCKADSYYGFKPD
jgi:hypothetical protein